MKLFEIFGEIKIDGDGALKTLSNTDEKGSKVAKSFGKSAKAIGKAGKIAAIGVGAIATGLGVMATKTADAGDRIDKMSQKLGLSRQAFQEWDYILSQNGASIDSMGAGMKTLTNQFDELAKGGKVATDAFSALNLTYEDLEGMTQEEIFETTIVALQGVEDEAKRAAIANDLLGRSGQELAPLLNAGAESVENLKNQANDLGLVMGDDAVDASVKFTDTMDTLKRSFGAVGLELGTALIPIFDKFANWIINNLPTIKKVAGDVFEYTKNAVMFLYDAFETYLLPVFQSLFNWVGENMETIKSTVSTAFEVIAAVVSTAWDMFNQYLLPVLQNIFAFVKDNWPTFQSIFETTFEVIKTVASLAYDVFKVIFDVLVSLYEWLEPTFPLFGEIISGAFDIIVGAVQLGIDIFETILEVAKDTIETIKEALKWIGLLDNKKTLSDSQRTQAENAGVSQSDIDTFEKEVLQNPLTKPMFGGFRAKGGPVSSGSSYVVGEQGPEMFVPKTSGTIIPNHSMGQKVITFAQGAFDGLILMDDYGVDRLMDRIVGRMNELGVST